MEHARTGLKKLIFEALRTAPPDEVAVLAWPLVCGAAVAGKSRAVAVRERALLIEVADAAWRSQLAELAPRYLASLNELTPGTVSRIEFVVKSSEP